MISENIRKYRLLNKITQAELASRLGKTKNVISHWEHGRNNPDIEAIEAICKILKITPDQLFGWKGGKDAVQKA